MYEDEEHLDEAEEDLTTEKISKPPDISTWGKSSDSEEMTALRKEWEDSIKDFTRIRRAQTSTRNNPGKFRPELSPIGWNKNSKKIRVEVIQNGHRESAISTLHMRITADQAKWKENPPKTTKPHADINSVNQTLTEKY